MLVPPGWTALGIDLPRRARQVVGERQPLIRRARWIQTVFAMLGLFKGLARSSVWLPTNLLGMLETKAVELD